MKACFALSQPDQPLTVSSPAIAPAARDTVEATEASLIVGENEHKPDKTLKLTLVQETGTWTTITGLLGTRVTGAHHLLYDQTGQIPRERLISPAGAAQIRELPTPHTTPTQPTSHRDLH